VSGMESFIKDHAPMKVLTLLATMAVLTLSMSGCKSATEESRMLEPMHITLQVVDDNGEPPGNAAVKIHQLVPGRDKFFCLELPTWGPRGKGCGTWERFPIFKGELPASGSIDFTAEYLTGLYIEVAETCDNTEPNARRRYFRRTLHTVELLTGSKTITVDPRDKPQLGYRIRYEPCTARMPSLENWSDYY